MLYSASFAASKKLLCSLTRSGFSRAETINKISIPFKASTTSGIGIHHLRISADA